MPGTFPLHHPTSVTCPTTPHVCTVSSHFKTFEKSLFPLSSAKHHGAKVVGCPTGVILLGKSQEPRLIGHYSSHRTTSPAHIGAGGNVPIGLGRLALSIPRCQWILPYSQNLEPPLLSSIYFPARDHNCTTELIERKWKSLFFLSLPLSKQNYRSWNMRFQPQAQPNWSELLGVSWYICEIHVDYS